MKFKDKRNEEQVTDVISDLINRLIVYNCCEVGDNNG